MISIAIPMIRNTDAAGNPTDSINPAVWSKFMILKIAPGINTSAIKILAINGKTFDILSPNPIRGY